MRSGRDISNHLLLCLPYWTTAQNSYHAAGHSRLCPWRAPRYCSPNRPHLDSSAFVFDHWSGCFYQQREHIQLHSCAVRYLYSHTGIYSHCKSDRLSSFDSGISLRLFLAPAEPRSGVRLLQPVQKSEEEFSSCAWRTRRVWRRFVAVSSTSNDLASLMNYPGKLMIKLHEMFRRRHQTLCRAVRKVDGFMRLSNVAGFVCHIINIILLLYCIIFYPESTKTGPIAFTYVFWLCANITCLFFSAGSGVIVNRMVSRPIYPLGPFLYLTVFQSMLTVLQLCLYFHVKLLHVITVDAVRCQLIWEVVLPFVRQNWLRMLLYTIQNASVPIICTSTFKFDPPFLFAFIMFNMHALNFVSWFWKKILKLLPPDAIF